MSSPNLGMFFTCVKNTFNNHARLSNCLTFILMLVIFQKPEPSHMWIIILITLLRIIQMEPAQFVRKLKHPHRVPVQFVHSHSEISRYQAISAVFSLWQYRGVENIITKSFHLYKEAH